MTFDQLIIHRQSVRKYSSQAVEHEKLMQCLDAARLAPSASNSQPWSFIVLNDSEQREKVARATKGPLGSFNNFVVQAPVLVVMPQLRPLIARYARSFSKGLKVLSYNEIPEDLRVEVIGTLG